jgi:hypothetical protein
MLATRPGDETCCLRLAASNKLHKQATPVGEARLTLALPVPEVFVSLALWAAPADPGGADGDLALES